VINCQDTVLDDCGFYSPVESLDVKSTEECQEKTKSKKLSSFYYQNRTSSCNMLDKEISKFVNRCKKIGAEMNCTKMSDDCVINPYFL